MHKILIAHAKDDENLADAIAEPLRKEGYEVSHRGTFLVGKSHYGEISKLLNNDVAIIFCGTVRAVGTSDAKFVVNAARNSNLPIPIFILQMEKEADVESISFTVLATFKAFSFISDVILLQIQKPFGQSTAFAQCIYLFQFLPIQRVNHGIVIGNALVLLRWVFVVIPVEG